MNQENQAPVQETPVVAEQAAIDAERAQALAAPVVESQTLHQMPDGSIVTANELAASQARGEDRSEVYSGGRR